MSIKIIIKGKNHLALVIKIKLTSINKMAKKMSLLALDALSFEDLLIHTTKSIKKILSYKLKSL
jgi:hypothetical protein